MELSKINAQNLVKIYGKRTVVNDLSLEIKQGEVVGILGPNGAGKTTTFYMIIGLAKPNRGKVLLNDVDITHKAMYKRARMGMGYLAQAPSIFAKLSVEDNIMAILETLKIPHKERKRRLDEALQELSISKLAKQKAYTLSGGERRKLEITRALVTNPTFIFMDEPFAGVDPIAVADIQDIIEKLRTKNIGVMITDHNVIETLKIVNRAYIIYEGKIIVSGSSRELINDENAKRVYLGERFTMSPFDERI
ncbi:MAG: LPS export ABC transporter ATP-binding protein [Candidatus Cloacimonetes bacterium]|jgi:lipopolysaccharide export system ATP-binding protein|nr:LPS export ABC transporter ATP-binding protein [Candidatus Cloacimonadota bacterium]MDY0298240.1 LPS export ABC transporter ATP-binding protein [Candidatus Cloacimonadaceae bacterium]MCB5278087.1 LPS export ABC transporter ATP-binding protein [Candidatus Cloacimonadota bacterium]MCK9331696.1 LPS export ABC transporter ATP-binding protein [Candidatus Cloacimonadota bacterium]MDD2209836.1 LPS export ABC transporter ATP-binding protein [Candidatus Cloacimonadota bacterium]